MLIPIRTDAPLRSTPYVNYGLILLNIVMFALQKFSEAGALPIDLRGYALDPGDPHLAHYFTYAFLHAGWLHLISNMLFLYIFGNNVSDKVGQWAYLALYLGGGVFAGIGYVVTADPTPQGLYAPVVGASGAIAAVTGAFMVLYPKTYVTVFYFLGLIGVAEIQALLFVAAFFLMDVVMGTLGMSLGVAHSAHVSGTIFGFCVALGLLATRLVERDQWDLLALIQRWNRRRQYRSAVATGWNPYGALPQPAGVPVKAAAADPREALIIDLRAQVAEAVAHRNLPGAVEHYLRLRSIDPTQVMSRSTQLDVANQLAEQANFLQAAEAYELFLRHYRDHEQHAHIELLTGIIYSRYLDAPQKAVAHIEHAMPRLTSARDVEMARAELGRLKPGGA